MDRRCFLLLFLSAGLVGCLGSLRLPNISATEAPPKGQGLLLVRINLQVETPQYLDDPPVSITLIDQRNVTVASAIFPLQLGENVRVVALPPGKYSWRGIYGGRLSSEFRGKLLFDVRADTATYVGDLDLSIDWRWRWELGVVDRSGPMKARYESEFPVAARSFPFATSLTEGNARP